MRILFDGAIYRIQSVGGINRYFAQLIAQLPEHVTSVLLCSQQQQNNFPTHHRLRLLQHNALRWPKPFRSLGDSLHDRKFLKLANNFDADIVHPTYYTTLSNQYKQRGSVPIVLTVYDMIHERFSRTLDPEGKIREIKRQAILAADSIICISQNTKTDLLNLYNLQEERVSVIYLASDMDCIAPAAPEVAPQRPYFLFVGSRESYKNFDRLLQAMQVVVARWTDLVLAVVGRRFRPCERRKIEESGLESHVVNYGNVDDRCLARLYKSSVALAYPSLYEGFGLPPLEAMSCGTAVIASNSGSIPEVTGNAALLCNPLSTEEWSSAMLQLLDDPSLRKRLIDLGREQADKYSWNRMAAETLSVYQSVASRASKKPRPGNRQGLTPSVA